MKSLPVRVRSRLCPEILLSTKDVHRESKNGDTILLSISLLSKLIGRFLADRTNGRAYATVLRLSSSVVCRL